MNEWLKIHYSMIRWHFYKVPEKIWMFVAWKLPHTLTMWAAIRVGAYATTGKYSSQIVPELTFMDAIKRWDYAHERN